MERDTTASRARRHRVDGYRFCGGFRARCSRHYAGHLHCLLVERLRDTRAARALLRGGRHIPALSLPASGRRYDSDLRGPENGTQRKTDGFDAGVAHRDRRNCRARDRSLFRRGSQESERRQCLDFRSRHHPKFKTSKRGSVISSIAYRSPSRPSPDSFTPPYGMESIRNADISPAITPPTSSSSKALNNNFASCVNTPACKPYGESLTRRIASSNSSYGSTTTTGAKTSWQFTFMSGRVSVSTAGSRIEPVRLPPHSNFAPFAVASSIHAAARRAASSLIIGPTSVASSSGSPTLSFLTPAISVSRNFGSTLRCTKIRCTEMQLCPA